MNDKKSPQGVIDEDLANSGVVEDLSGKQDKKAPGTAAQDAVTIDARSAIGGLELSEEEAPLDAEKLRVVKARVLEIVRFHLEQKYDFGYDGFNEIRQDLSEPMNHIWIGDVKHVQVSDDPKLIATIFTEKIQDYRSLAAPKKHICLLISTEPLQKQDLIDKYDESLDKEMIAFTVEFNFDGYNRHSLKHRYVDPKFRGGLGTPVLKEYEKYFQKMANDTGESQSHVILTQKKLTLDWARKNHYIPDTERDAKLIAKLEAIDQGVTVEGEDIYLESGPDKIKTRVGIELRKDFIPE
ncbi:MAG: hypothetical protein Q8P68_00260 [Candidatus Peregrinibacteria bacterium]|nr:hypothetical protein [Candidatus Peregrinibacteria bacterium]MDZ4244596.1 hypothetical protein [Candidatus Gracilibacteria bacterium]